MSTRDYDDDRIRDERDRDLVDERDRDRVDDRDVVDRDRDDVAETRHLDRDRIDVRDADDADDARARRSGTPVDVRTDRVSVDRTRGDVGIAEAHSRFGGIDVPATLVGMLTALALVVLLSGLVTAAIGAVGYQTGLDSEDVEDIGIASLIGGLVVLFLSFLFGGWAAGRIARYDGPRNGLMTVVWTIILAAILGALGAWAGDEYDVFRNVDLPQWFSEEALTTTAIISGLVAIAAMLLGGMLGGAWGERYHRRADAAIASTRPGALHEREVERR